MEANQYISLVLLIGRIGALVILFAVLKKQRKALRAKSYPELRSIRIRNLAGTVVLMGMQILPITIDVFGLFNRGSFGLLLAYVFSNNLSALLYSYMLYSNIRLAERIVISDE